ncbi:MAG: hypothetical protein Q9167_004732 [Letrouitia subvulpina]
MEALAVINLAGNILQFIDFVRDVVSKSRRVVSSEDEHRDDITHHLKGLNNKLLSVPNDVDTSLKKLCCQCISVADDLLLILENSKVRKEMTRLQSLRKALKSVWGRERIVELEKQLSTFRQELTLCILVDQKTQFDLSSRKTIEWLESVDHSTQRRVEDVLKSLRDGNQEVLSSIEARAREIKGLQNVTQAHITEEVTKLGGVLNQENDKARALAADDVHLSQAKIINAIDRGAIAQGEAISSASDDISALVKEEVTRSHSLLSDSVDVNYQMTKQQIDGLQTGLKQLQAEIDSKTEELKTLITRIDNTWNGKERQQLKERGNKVMVTLFSLNELYKNLGSAIEDGLTSLLQTPDDSAPLSELRVIYDLAKEGHELIWTLTAIVAALNALLIQKEAVVEVVETVFSIRYNPGCIPREYTTMDIKDVFTHYFRPFSCLRKPRFSTNSILGQRLVQDLELWSHLAKVSGLQQKAFSLCRVRPTCNGPEIASNFYAFLRQPWPWTIKFSPQSARALADSATWCFKGQRLDTNPLAEPTPPIITFSEVIMGLGVNLIIQENQIIEPRHCEMFSSPPKKVGSFPEMASSSYELSGPPLELPGSLPRSELSTLELPDYPLAEFDRKFKVRELSSDTASGSSGRL